MKDHQFVEPVHELRREFASSGFHGGTLHAACQIVIGLFGRPYETDAALHQLGDLAAAQVGGEENHSLRQIDAAVVSQCEGGFVQHSQQQLPQCVGGLF